MTVVSKQVAFMIQNAVSSSFSVVSCQKPLHGQMVRIFGRYNSISDPLLTQYTKVKSMCFVLKTSALKLLLLLEDYQKQCRMPNISVLYYICMSAQDRREKLEAPGHKRKIKPRASEASREFLWSRTSL